MNWANHVCGFKHPGMTAAGPTPIKVSAEGFGFPDWLRRTLDGHCFLGWMRCDGPFQTDPVMGGRNPLPFRLILFM
jgi:hypothetical protein